MGWPAFRLPATCADRRRRRGRRPGRPGRRRRCARWSRRLPPRRHPPARAVPPIPARSRERTGRAQRRTSSCPRPARSRTKAARPADTSATDVGQHVGELVRAEARQVGAQRDRHGARPAAYDLCRGLHERRVEVLARPVGHHLDADPDLQAAHRRGQAEVVGDDQHGRHAAGLRGRLHGVERERLGQLAALLVGEPDQPGLAERRGLHGYDDHAPVGGVGGWIGGRHGGGHHRRSSHPTTARRRRPTTRPTE